MPGNKTTVHLHVCNKTDLNLDLTTFQKPRKQGVFSPRNVV